MLRAIIVPPGQSLDMDEGKASRKWLWPYLNSNWHLKEFVEIVDPLAENG
jgi:hypothetical protein